jgi:hypothetical protein
VGSVRRACLDWTIIAGQRHLKWELDEYVDHTTGSGRIVDSNCTLRMAVSSESAPQELSDVGEARRFASQVLALSEPARCMNNCTRQADYRLCGNCDRLNRVDH